MAAKTFTHVLGVLMVTSFCVATAILVFNPTDVTIGSVGSDLFHWFATSIMAGLIFIAALIIVDPTDY